MKIKYCKLKDIEDLFSALDFCPDPDGDVFICGKVGCKDCRIEYLNEWLKKHWKKGNLSESKDI
jgi:hypothetical protein